MTDDPNTATRRLALANWHHNPSREAGWAAMHEAGMVSAAEPPMQMRISRLTTEAMLRNLGFAADCIAAGNTQQAAHLIGLVQEDLLRVAGGSLAAAAE